ncbi:sensor histidine kinase [Anaerostipes sp.]|uniref:sensor histidine kinase n=1 Tax=Anaerostipes sp. TaxID=1872530 RepID=UPI0025C09AC8|nr:sensor histidine kinase [Anaerostipes sp.]MBS7009208.1 sensor histidine kinase [Anaerostipes sp.]
MRFARYCKDKWISIFIFLAVFLTGGFLLLLIDTPPAVACVVEGFYAAGFFLILVQDYLARREFYGHLSEISRDLDEISYLSEFLEEPSFLEGQILYRILQRDEKFMNDRIAQGQRELQEYREYVEMWVHEIKTPIAVSRLMMEKHRDELTRSLSEEMDKMEQFVEQMLYYSKSSSLQEDYMIRRVPLKPLVMGAVKAHSKSMVAQKAVPRFGDLNYTVLTDPKWMSFILGQIITNGVKYHSKERKPELVFSAFREENTVVLSVADNGIGIPPEDVPRIFRKGFTGSNGRQYRKSTGMGLYLCEKLCRKLGIELSVSSEAGKGTVFSLRMPLASENENDGI